MQVFNRVQQKMPTISLATVYNCLETLTQCGLVQQVNLDRGPSRFCPNTERSTRTFFAPNAAASTTLICPTRSELSRIWRLPDAYVVSHYEFSLRGLCRQCAENPAADFHTMNQSLVIKDLCVSIQGTSHRQKPQPGNPQG